MYGVLSDHLYSAEQLPITLGDPRWLVEKGWVKTQRIVIEIVIHINYNTSTGEFADFKFS